MDTSRALALGMLVPLPVSCTMREELDFRRINIDYAHARSMSAVNEWELKCGVLFCCRHRPVRVVYDLGDCGQFHMGESGGD